MLSRLACWLLWDLSDSGLLWCYLQSLPLSKATASPQDPTIALMPDKVYTEAVVLRVKDTKIWIKQTKISRLLTEQLELLPVLQRFRALGSNILGLQWSKEENKFPHHYSIVSPPTFCKIIFKHKERMK